MNTWQGTPEWISEQILLCLLRKPQLVKGKERSKVSVLFLENRKCLDFKMPVKMSQEGRGKGRETHTLENASLFRLRG